MWEKKVVFTIRRNDRETDKERRAKKRPRVKKKYALIELARRRHGVFSNRWLLGKGGGI